MPIMPTPSPCPDGTCCVNMETDASGHVTGPKKTSVEPSQSVVLFRFFSVNSPEIKGVHFYSDEKKTVPKNDFYFHAENFGVKNWRVQLNSKFDETLTVYYTVVFDVGMLLDNDWDPTLVIEPRTA